MNDLTKCPMIRCHLKWFDVFSNDAICVNTACVQPRTQALYVLIIQLYIERSVNKLASARGCLGRF